MPQLDPTYFISQLFWLLVTFTAMYVVLARISLPRIREVLQDRQTRVSSDIERAEQLHNEANAAKDDYLTRLAEARKTSSQLTSSASDEINTESLKRHLQLDKRLDQQTKEAESRIVDMKEQIKERLADESDALAEHIFNKVTS